MGHIRKSYLAVAAFFALASVVLLSVALAIPDWQEIHSVYVKILFRCAPSEQDLPLLTSASSCGPFSIFTDTEVRRYGLWAYKSCDSITEPPCSSPRSQARPYTDCTNLDGPDCPQNRYVFQLLPLLDTSMTCSLVMKGLVQLARLQN